MLGGVSTSNSAIDPHTDHVVIQVAAQMLFQILFCCVLVDFVRNYALRRPVNQWRLRKTREVRSVDHECIEPSVRRKTRNLIIALVLSTALLLVRGVYRVIELHGGWDSAIMNNEVGIDALKRSNH